MILINFTLPLSDAQLTQLTKRVGRSSSQVLEVATDFDEGPYAEQVKTLVEQVPLTAAQWQGEPILIVPPALNFITAALLAELHGRMGYFPPVVRTRPIPNTPLRQFEIAEIMDLQNIREQARMSR